MIKDTIKLFVLWKALILIVAILAIYFVPFQDKPWLGKYHAQNPHPYILWIWANFDGSNYLDIVRYGYKYPNFAYFPLFSFVTYLVKQISMTTHIIAGLIVSNIASLIGFIFLAKITLLDYSRSITKRTVLFALIIPTSFYYQAIYADSLYFLLSTASFYYARKSKWFTSGILGYFASLTRLVGIFLFIALCVEWFLQNRKTKNIQKLITLFFQKKVYFLFLIPLGIVTYSLYLHFYHGDYLLFQKAMSHWNQSQIVLPIQVVFRYIKIFLTAPKDITFFVALIEFIATFFLLFLSVYTLKKVRISYGFFIFLTILLPTFTGTFQSMPRYVLHVFPAFIALALLTKNSKKMFWAIATIFVVLEIIFISLFTRGYFVA